MLLYLFIFIILTVGVLWFFRGASSWKTKDDLRDDDSEQLHFLEEWEKEKDRRS